MPIDIKITCDICKTEKDVRPCLAAGGSLLCDKCHNEFHELVHDDMKIVENRAFEIANNALNKLKKEIPLPTDNVIPIRH